MIFLNRMLLRLALLSTLWAMSPAAAQSITARAGEHGDFTRLVLEIAGLQSWDFGRTENGYGLRWDFDPETDGASPDISQTFTKITRNRLGDLRLGQAENGGEDALFLDLACDCHARPFLFRDRFVVIDIYDGPAPADSPFEIAFENPPAAIAAPALAVGPNTPDQVKYDWLAMTAAPPLATPRPAAAAERPDPAPVAAEPDPAPKAETAPPPGASLETALELDGFRQGLIESLSSAASTGRVTLAPEVMETTDLPVEIKPQDPAAALSHPPGVNLGDGGPLAADGRACPPADLFDLRAWSDALGENGYARMTESRADMVGEFDDLLPEAVIETAKSYLALGFGHEARALISSLPLRTDETEIIKALGYIVDGEAIPENPLAGFHGCASDAALWSLLASPDGAPLQNLDTDAVTIAFLGLPPHLRLQLASELADRLLQNNAESSAKTVRDATLRAGPEGARMTPVLDAKFELATDDPAAALRALETAEVTDAEVLITLAEARFKQNSPLQADDLLALESFVFSEGEGENGPALRRALALARALDGQAEEALALAQGDARTMADLWAFIAELGSDSALLAAAGNADGATIETLAPDVRTRIAQRLIELGLPDIARDWLPDAANQPDLMAAIYLAERDGLAALTEINRSAAAAQDRDLQRAVAYRGLGDYAKAAEILAAQGQIAEAERIQRWSQIWDPASSQVDDLWRQIGLDAGRITSEGAPATLQLGKDLLARSTGTRERVLTLLSETDLSGSASGVENPEAGGP